MMILVLYWKSSTILPRCLILHCHFVHAIAPVSLYFLSITMVFFSFRVSFQVFKCFSRMFFVCFETWIVLFIPIFFVLYFCHLYLYTCVNKTLCIIKKCTCKVDFMVFMILQWYCWCLRQTFCPIFQDWNICIWCRKEITIFFLVIVVFVLCCF